MTKKKRSAPRRKHGGGRGKILLLVVLLGVLAGLYFLRYRPQYMPAPPEKFQTGYKKEDQKKLEELMREGAIHHD